jgi:hypothetical protein
MRNAVDMRALSYLSEGADVLGSQLRGKIGNCLCKLIRRQHLISFELNSGQCTPQFTPDKKAWRQILIDEKRRQPGLLGYTRMENDWDVPSRHHKEIIAYLLLAGVANRTLPRILPSGEKESAL